VSSNIPRGYKLKHLSQAKAETFTGGFKAGWGIQQTLCSQLVHFSIHPSTVRCEGRTKRVEKEQGMSFPRGIMLRLGGKNNCRQFGKHMGYFQQAVHAVPVWGLKSP